MPQPGEVAASRFIDRTTEREPALQTLAAVISHGQLLKLLVLRDLKLKYRGSVLGFLWSLVSPLALLLVYTFAFKVILRVDQPDYAFFVLLGVLAWTFFANAITMATGAIIESASLVKSVRFPMAILPVSTVFFNLAQYLLTIVVFLPAMLAIHGKGLQWPMLLFPAVLALQVMCTTGVALALSAATTYFRDVRHFVDVALPLLFWTTPIVYSPDIVPASVRPVVFLSPMSPFIIAYQQIFYKGQWPELTTALMAAAYGVGVLFAGISLFLAWQAELTEQL